jgi:hypothetical protein
MLLLTAEIIVDENTTITLDRTNLLAINVELKSRADISKPSFGIMCGSGSISFIDWADEIQDLAKTGSLTSDLPVNIYITDTNSAKSEKVGVLTTDKWSVEVNNRTIEVSLRDNLMEWQDIKIDKISLYNGNRTLGNIYTELLALTPTKHNMLALASLDDRTKAQLNGTTCTYRYLESGTLWEQWKKLCDVSGSNIYKDRNGNTTFVWQFVD